MAVYDAGGYKLVMRDPNDCDPLTTDGWTVIASGTTKSDEPVWYWLLTPPEPTPTLAETMRGNSSAMIQSGRAPYHWAIDCSRAADALEHYARVEAAASEVVASWDRADRRAMVSIELLWRLADALNEGKKAAGAKAFTGGDQ